MELHTQNVQTATDVKLVRTCLGLFVFVITTIQKDIPGFWEIIKLVNLRRRHIMIVRPVLVMIMHYDRSDQI